MAEIRDGDAYSITIADDARPCIVFPAGLFDKTQCLDETREVLRRLRGFLGAGRFDVRLGITPAAPWHIRPMTWFGSNKRIISFAKPSLEP